LPNVPSAAHKRRPLQLQHLEQQLKKQQQQATAAAAAVGSIR